MTARRIEKAARDETLDKAPWLVVLITKWGEWEGDKAVREWLTRILEDDEKLGKLLVSLLRREPTDGGELRRLNPAWLEPFAGRDELVRSVRRLEQNAAGDVQAAVAAFLDDLAILEAGRDPDDPFLDRH